MKNDKSADEKSQKPKKKQGPIRTEAVVPFLIVAVLVWGYFHFLFDKNIKSLLEYGGYQIIGAEVDIATLDTSFWNASFRMQGIEITNSEKPSSNIIRIGDIRYGLNWDGLLRARFVVNEMAIEQIEFNTQRSHPGRVKPPEPPKPKSTEPSALEKEGNKLKNEALEKTKEQYSDNILGDVASMLSGTSGGDQIKNIENSLPSKAKLQQFEVELKAKQDKWQTKLKTLPQGPEIQALGDRLNKVKIKDFKSPQELQDSLKQIEVIFKDADSKVKAVQATSDEFNADFKSIDQNFKEIDAQVKKDIKDLEARFKIPQIDAKSITRSLFYRYMGPYLNMFNKYKLMAEKYMPPKVLSQVKGQNTNKEDSEIEIKPHPRAKGVTYEFGRANSYPLFWIKNISISSQAGATKEAGNIKGQITNITSNQKLIGKPTVGIIEGNFPGMNVSGLAAKISLDTTNEESRLDYEFKVASYPIDGKELVNSPEAHVAFKKAEGSINSSGSLIALNTFQFKLENQIQKIEYDTSAKNEVVDGILKDVFKNIPIVTLEADGKGELPDLPMNLDSNLGRELQKGFEKQLKKRIDEEKEKLQAAIDQAIGKQKEQIEAQISKAKNQYEIELKKINDQIQTQKNQANTKVDGAKKDAENQAKKKVEGEGKKVIDDLKNKFGL